VFTIQEAEPTSSATMTGNAETIEGALDAAWQLCRYYGAPAVIVEDGRRLAVVSVEWLDE
jgi:hypothetical protein